LKLYYCELKPYDTASAKLFIFHHSTSLRLYLFLLGIRTHLHTRSIFIPSFLNLFSPCHYNTWTPENHLICYFRNLRQLSTDFCTQNSSAVRLKTRNHRLYLNRRKTTISALFQKTKNHYPTSKASKNPTRQLLHTKLVSFTLIFCKTRQVIRMRNSSVFLPRTRHPLHTISVRSTKLTKRLSHVETVRC